ncbi:MAG: cbb3-type cytochrome c oxidase subunit I [Acidobacteriaceae bacterium]
MSTAVQQKLLDMWESPHTLRAWFATVDHKKLGKRYLATAFLFLVIGGIEALIMRLQLARANQALVTPEMYDQLFSMHGITMIFWYAAPILSGFSVYFVPLLIGARDLAFPRLNAFTYWTFVLSFILLYMSAISGQAPHAGWFAHAPYTELKYSPGYGMDAFAMALILFTISNTGGGINFIVTILRMRAPGMSISKMPIYLYSTLTMSFLSVIAMPALTAACVFLELDRHWHTHFYQVAYGGDPILWQQLFWFFGHPWVYVIFLPATGILSMCIPVFCRRPIVGYPYVVLSTVLTGVTGFGVWLHHMFSIGMSHMAMSFFSAGSMTIALFTSVQIFAWIATMWRGRPILTTSMLFALGAIVNLVIGGLSGVATAVVPVDWQLHETYFLPAHIHYVLIGANVFPVFAGLYYWLPKITGRMMDEIKGKWSFWVMFIGFNVAFFPMHLSGIAGMPRRVYTYPPGLALGGLNMTSTIGAFIFGLGILISVWNFFASLRYGRLAGKDPWRGETLEWATDSPPAPYEVEHIPTVVSRSPMWDDHDQDYDPDNERILDQGRLTLATTWLDANPLAITRIPEDSLAPLWLSIALFIFFGAIIMDWMLVALASIILSALLSFYWVWPKPQKEAA